MKEGATALSVGDSENADRGNMACGAGKSVTQRDSPSGLDSSKWKKSRKYVQNTGSPSRTERERKKWKKWETGKRRRREIAS